ncbi:MAG: hypothetical protein ACJ77G_14830 [Solirubrobacteraceae bacterium]
MARIGPTVIERRRLDQPVVGVVHRASRRVRAQVGGTLLPPALTRLQTALDPTRDTSGRPRLHASTVA